MRSFLRLSREPAFPKCSVYIRASIRYNSSSAHSPHTDEGGFTFNVENKPLPTGGHVSHLFFRGPKKLPILRERNMENMRLILREIARDDAVRALFLRSTIAGADLNVMKEIKTPDQAGNFIAGIESLCGDLQDYKVPVIAVIDGPCLGAGMEVAASCDVRIGVEGSKTIFGMPETRVGIPSVAQAALLPGLIGWGRARELLLFGDHISAQTAMSWGFLNHLIPPSSVSGEIQRLEALVDKTGPRALRDQKALMRKWEETHLSLGRGAIRYGHQAFQDAFKTHEPNVMMQRQLDSRMGRQAVGKKE